VFTNRMLLYSIILTALTSAPMAFSQQTGEKKFNLEQCIDIALQNNPQILASQIGVAELRTRIPQARAGFYPSLNLNADASRLSAEPGLNTKNITGNYNTGLYLRYNIFQGGKTVASVNAARYDYQSAEAGYMSSQQDLILTVTEAYYRVIQAEQFARVSEKALQRSQSHLDFANARLKAGLASRSDILKAKTEQSNAKLDLIHTRNAIFMARGQLNNALGRNVNWPIIIVDDLSKTVTSDAEDNHWNFQTLVKNAYKNRPELRKIENQLQAQRSFIRLAKADYYPSISLDASYNFSGAEISQLYQSNYVGISVSLPLFSGFSRP